ncbi:MAG: DUF4199 domain-containing protein [Bacteroidales bacterium]|nr:DUF4199 domain-containing protein [Bacteroidales bacterium]
MENKSTFTPALQFGLLTGLGMIVYSLIMYLLGVNYKSTWNLLNYLIILVGIFWGMVSIRDRYLDNVMPYGKAFGVGFWIVLFAVLLSSIYSFIFLKYIDPSVLENAMSEAQDKILAANPNISDADLDKAMSMARKFATPAFSAITGFVWNVIVGTVLSLIIAIFAKREDKTIA